MNECNQYVECAPFPLGEGLGMGLWSYTVDDTNALFADRGFTGHEHLTEFGLINMNGRLYDPVVGRFLSPDNYVQSPDFTQSFNRYGYCWNNPLRYTDPEGDFLIPLLLLGTETGYDIQKYLFPFAIHIDLNYSTHKKGVGVEFSYGIPQAMVFNARVNGGASYNWENYFISPGWEFNYGYEFGSNLIQVGSTVYDSPGNKFDQKLGHLKVGNPLVNAQYYNDWFFDTKMGDGGDRYRTSGVKLKLGMFSFGLNMFTGDPGTPENRVKPIDPITGKPTYVKNLLGNNPDEYRSGVLYVGILNLRVGYDSESIRNYIQNEMIHGDKYPWFKKLPDIKDRFYFGIISEIGSW